jgi:anti-anti-sigma factor
MEPVRLHLEKLPVSNGNLTVTRLEGKLALESVTVFLQTMRPEPAASLILDMSGVAYLDSAGVGALVQLFVHRRSGGKKFALAALTPQGVAVMQVSGLMKLLPVFPSVEAALAQNS